MLFTHVDCCADYNRHTPQKLQALKRKLFIAEDARKPWLPTSQSTVRAKRYRAHKLTLEGALIQPPRGTPRHPDHLQVHLLSIMVRRCMAVNKTSWTAVDDDLLEFMESQPEWLQFSATLNVRGEDPTTGDLVACVQTEAANEGDHLSEYIVTPSEVHQVISVKHVLVWEHDHVWCTARMLKSSDAQDIARYMRYKGVRQLNDEQALRHSLLEHFGAPSVQRIEDIFKDQMYADIVSFKQVSTITWPCLRACCKYMCFLTKPSVFCMPLRVTGPP